MSSGSHTKNPSRVASGLKATIHNPNVSEEAKGRARERLAQMGESSAEYEAQPPVNDLEYNEEEIDEFEEEDVVFEQSQPAGTGSQETEHRVLGGYKATMHNPRVSQKAKDHAKQVLEENDAL